MRSIKTVAIGMLAVAGFAASATGASAAIACSGTVCWHTHEHYTYPPEARVTIHEDDWHWGPNEHYEFREHEGRGYWAGERWEEF